MKVCEDVFLFTACIFVGVTLGVSSGMIVVMALLGVI
jgi:hypothetical protein